MAVRVVAPLAFIREPAVGPDLRRAQNLSARAQNDPEGFVVENQGEGERCHAQFPVVSRKAAVQASRQERVLTTRSEEHTSELQSQSNLVCRLLLEKKK